jgi:protein ImuA
MLSAKANILKQLERDILSLQGLKRLPPGTGFNFGLGPIEDAFPNNCFPIAAVHEFISPGAVNSAATSGFIAGITATLMRNNGVAVWISPSQSIFPPALKTFGLDPDKIIFINHLQPKEILWTMEETLKCDGLAAVIGELPAIDFTASRRLQLAVEQHRITGFIVCTGNRPPSVNACVSRWKITTLASEENESLPGIGFPRWNVELLKIRNGKPGSWQVEWKEDRFHIIAPSVEYAEEEQKRKVG